MKLQFEEVDQLEETERGIEARCVISFCRIDLIDLLLCKVIIIIQRVISAIKLLVFSFLTAFDCASQQNC
jgi:hypothetical protein